MPEFPKRTDPQFHIISIPSSADATPAQVTAGAKFAPPKKCRILAQNDFTAHNKIGSIGTATRKTECPLHLSRSNMNQEILQIKRKPHTCIQLWCRVFNTLRKNLTITHAGTERTHDKLQKFVCIFTSVQCEHCHKQHSIYFHSMSTSKIGKV